MSEMTLKPNEKLDVRNILKDLDKYDASAGDGLGASPPPTWRWAPLPTTMCPSR